jgi:predicted RNA binding protein YcfA (HicA-like mRNA interferase family)
MERDPEDLERRARTELAIRSSARSRDSFSSLLSPSFCLDRSSLNFPRPFLVEPVVVFTILYLIIKSENSLGFAERIKGSHHIFSHPDIEEILNLRPRGSLAKPYQVKQVRKVIVRYKLVPESE